MLSPSTLILIEMFFRFRDIALMSEKRRSALQYSSEFHSLSQEIEDEKLWIKEKCVYLESQEFGSDLASKLFSVI